MSGRVGRSPGAGPAGGGGRPTLEDVAARAGVGRGTASRALTGAPNVAAHTRRRVLAAAAELGYATDAAARALAGGPGDRVAIVSLVHDWSPAEDPFLAAVVAGAAAAAGAAGLGVTLHRIAVGAALDAVAADRRLAGLILVNPVPAALDALPAAVLRRTVTLGGCRPDVPSVDMDNVGGAVAAVTHLLAAGRRRIVAMIGPDSLPCAAERLGTYERLLAGHGLRPRHVRSAPQRGPAAAAFVTLAGERPDAVFATHEEQGHGVLAVAARRGWSVPDDVAVVSFDDFPAPAGSRGYTSIGSVTPQLGAAAVGVLAAGAAAAGHQRLPVHLT